MLRLFVDVPLQPQAVLALPPGAARHVQVRRAQPGDALVLFDGRGGEWAARVVEMTRSGVTVELLAHEPVDRELPIEVTLAVGMPANDRMDWLVEKAVELGAAALQPLHCERAVLRLDGERAARRCAHWQAQAVAAAEQCGRTRVPPVHAVQPLEAFLRAAQAAAGVRRWVLSPRAGARPPRPAPGTQLWVLSGPEGGLAPDEEAAAQRAGFEPVSLGPRVLRADTAPLALLAALAWP